MTEQDRIERRDARIETLKARIAKGGYSSPDAYFADKDDLRRLCAERAGMQQHHYDPAGFWFGRMSN